MKIMCVLCLYTHLHPSCRHVYCTLSPHHTTRRPNSFHRPRYSHGHSHIHHSHSQRRWDRHSWSPSPHRHCMRSPNRSQLHRDPRHLQLERYSITIIWLAGRAVRRHGSDAIWDMTRYDEMTKLLPPSPVIAGSWQSYVQSPYRMYACWFIGRPASHLQCEV